ncbi:DUF45 domain-containing protein [Deinococcus sp. HMF7620]|uniref:DUF45 domain-containing protein n=1 Tax=Deinococcus arboris TaxID=2682977 RepID=A0A7C9HPN8_9DEIO|nr:YgjP-like metallopeptidase domain-containing protein [Deinococcus arboris]MVN85313.1 DUF45 domain-containing protein [Deinococcus arboris]
MRSGGRRVDGAGAAAPSALGDPRLTPVPAEWTLTLHDLTFTVRESARRRTVSLGLERDGALLILAPSGTDAGMLRQLVLSRQDWLYSKLADKTRLHRPRREREYVTGEGFFYAGRSYRLLLTEGAPEEEGLTLKGGRFRLHRAEASRGRELFIRWYSGHLSTWAEEQLFRLHSRLRVQPSSVRVTDLGQRWGSCGTGQAVALHWRVALLPRRMAEYVLVHELVHLEHHHHKASFWERLEVLLPDYAERKSWLAFHGAEYDL